MIMNIVFNVRNVSVLWLVCGLMNWGKNDRKNSMIFGFSILVRKFCMNSDLSGCGCLVVGVFVFLIGVLLCLGGVSSMWLFR